MLKLHKKDMGPTKRMLGYTSMMEEIIAMFLEEFGKPDSIEPLMKINDPVLGELTVGAFLSRVYSVDFYGKQQKVALVVQLFDGLEITENQRKTFIGFESNK